MSAQEARSHYAKQQKVSAGVLVAIRALLRRSQAAPDVARVVSAYQLAAAAVAADTYSKAFDTPKAVNPQAFMGWTSAGFPLTDPLEQMVKDLTAAVDKEAADLLASAEFRIERFAISEVQDAGRQASSVALVDMPLHENYVRVLTPPSCGRCAVLAGRIYRDLDGFQRHPLCDCVMWPVKDWGDAVRQGLGFDAIEAFDAGEVTGLSTADTQAIADGADFNQVVNAAQGMSTTNIFGHDVKATLYGTTKRAGWRQRNPDRLVRLRPESIYQIADGDRAEAIRLLRLYGYLI